MCCDRMGQDEALDVLSVVLAQGNAGLLYDSSFRCFYQRENTLGLQREGDRARDRNKASVPVCECVHGGYASAFFEHPQGVKVGEVFLRAGQSDR